MSSIDERVVAMKFQNSEFEQGIKTSLGSLDALKRGLKLEGASKGLTDVNSAARNMNLSGIASGVENISSKFTALGIIGVTALATIASKAVSAGIQFVKSFTTDPINAGLKEYETNLNAIQTVLANTASKGTTLKDVNAALAELNTYSDKTIYNFSQMARNIGTFTAAGVDLKTSTAAIKGIANLAAVSGSNADQASTAMYQLSQAMATGTVRLMDWNSVVNAGMGGEVFQNALKETARAHGVAVDDIIKKEGSFRDSLSKGWLKTDILTETLSKFTGDLTAAQLKAMGYTEKQIPGILKMAKTAQDAATKVKTFSQLVNTLQEAAGSGWTNTWQLIFGNFDEAKALWTGVNNVLGGMINASAKARNKVLTEWKKLGGRDLLINTLGDAFKNLGAILKPIKEAFREIFPAKTGKDLYNLTVRFHELVSNLKPTIQTVDNLKRTFAGVFAVFSIVGQVIRGVLGVFGRLAGTILSGSKGFLGFTASIGDYLVALNDALKSSHAIEKFFAKVGTILATPIKLFQALAGFIAGIFSGFQAGAGDVVSASLKRVGDRLSPLEQLGKRVAEAWGGLVRVFGKLGELLQPFIDGVVNAFQSLGKALSESFASGNFSGVLDAINTGLLAAIVVLIKKFFDHGLKLDFGNGMFAGIKDTFETLTGTLKAMQTQIKAKALLEIAGAVALLTVSVVALSLIDSGKLTKSLTAIGVVFGELLGAMELLTKIGASKGMAKIPLIAGSMILLSTAVLIMTAAVKNLAGLDWPGLAKGLLGVSGVLIAISLASKPLSANSAGMISSGIGIIALAVGMKILASAVTDFAKMKAGDLAKGLVAVAASLLIVAGAVNLMPPSMPAMGAGLILIGAGLKVVASAVGDFAKFNWKQLGKGMVGIAGSLLIIAGAMNLMPPTMIVNAAALVVVGVALQSIGKAVASMGGMSWSEIAKGLVTLAGSLVILAAGLYLMSGTLAGAAALVVAAAAIAVLTPALQVLGNMSWGEIIHSMVALAAAFVVLGVAGLVLGPLSPAILALGVALLAVGAGLALAGVGALAFATAFGIVVAAGTAGVSVMSAMLAVIISSIPAAMAAFGKGLVAFAAAIAAGAPAFIAAFTTMLTALLTAVIKTAPLIAKALSALLKAALKVLTDNIPGMVNAGMKLILGLLKGVRDHIGEIVAVVASLISNFLISLGKHMGEIVDAGFKMIINFLNGVADAIRNNSEKMGEAGANIASAIVDGMINFLKGAVGRVADAAANIAKSAFNAAKHFLGIGSPSKLFRDEIGARIVQGMIQGIGSMDSELSTASERVGRMAFDKVSKSISGLSDALSGNIDMTPVIAPVLDLSDIKNNAGKIGSLLSAQKVTVDAAYSTAKDASVGYQNNKTAETPKPEVQTTTPKQSLTFIQNNTSPKALSSADIYRQTRNQLSVARGALTP